MKEAYYFSHDSNAKDDPKCVMLIEQLGLEGYGIYWVLVETLRDQPTFKYPLALLPSIARRYNTTFEKVKAVVYSYALFVIDGDEFFFSKSLVERMSIRQSERDKKSLAGKRGNEVRWGTKAAIASPSQCDRSAISHASQGKERKGKEIKGKEKKDNNTVVSIETRQQTFKEEIFSFSNLYTTDMLADFYDYWTEKARGGAKMKFEREDTWELDKRLKRWSNNNYGNNRKNNCSGQSASDSNGRKQQIIRHAATVPGGGAGEVREQGEVATLF